MKSLKSEYLLYAVLWLLVFLFPFLDASKKVIDGSQFQWSHIGSFWLGMVPFLILFLLHTFLMIPCLLAKGHIKGYILSAIVVIVLFFGYQHFQHPRLDRDVPPRHLKSSAPVNPPLTIDEGFDWGPPPRIEKRVSGPVVIDTILAVLMLGCNLAISLMFDRHKKQHRIEELEKAQIEYKLNQLKSQVSPHFLMNMLNNIHGMMDINPEKAQEMILELSAMMRYVLYESSMPQIKLSKEIDFISNYISMMRERYSNKKVSVKLSVPEEDVSNHIFVPPLMFIIFIENAFKHGVSYRDFSFVNIEISIQKEQLIFRCVNSNRKYRQDEFRDKGIGLQNIRKRLEMLYENDFTLDIDEQEQSFSVTLTIPIYEHQMLSYR